MNYWYLGKTGLNDGELCLGAMTFGRESTEEVSRQILDRFKEIYLAILCALYGSIFLLFMCGRLSCPVAINQARAGRQPIN